MRFMNWSTRLDDPSRRMTARRKLGGLGEGGARLSDARAIPRSRPGCGAPRASRVIPRGRRPIAASLLWRSDRLVHAYRRGRPSVSLAVAHEGECCYFSYATLLSVVLVSLCC